MSVLEKTEVGIFVAIGIGLMVYGGDQAWDSVAWENKFMHSLGTVVLSGLGAGVVTLALFGIYYLFRSRWRGWGRVLVIPWLLLSMWLYRVYLARIDFPKTNPDPKGTAALFAVMMISML